MTKEEMERYEFELINSMPKIKNMEADNDGSNSRFDKYTKKFLKIIFFTVILVVTIIVFTLAIIH